MDERLVSVIIPVYNAEKTVEETISSVFNQTYKNLEIIVVDNGSTDRSLELLRGITDSRIRVISQTGTGSPSGPRNRGIKESSGDFIAFLDADDCWMKEKLAKQITFLNDNSDVALVASYFLLVDENSKRIGKKILPVVSEGASFEALCKNNFIANSTVLLRREILVKTGLLSGEPIYRMMEDYEFWLRVAKAYPIGIISEPLMQYRIHAGAASGMHSLEMAQGAFVAVARHVLCEVDGDLESVESEFEKQLVLPHFRNWVVQAAMQRGHNIECDHRESLDAWSKRLDCERWVVLVFAISRLFPAFLRSHFGKSRNGTLPRLIRRLFCG